MRAVTIELKRVFDVIHMGGKLAGHTLFSAELADGSRVLSVQIPGRLDVRAGMVLSLFVSDPTELRGVHAVRDDATGKLHRENTVTRIVWPFVELIFGSVLLAALLTALTPCSAPLALLLAGYAIWLLVQDRRASAAIARHL